MRPGERSAWGNCSSSTAIISSCWLAPRSTCTCAAGPTLPTSFKRPSWTPAAISSNFAAARQRRRPHPLGSRSRSAPQIAGREETDMNGPLPGGDSLEPSPQLLQILESYLEELESGGRPDPEELLARHPDLIEELRGCLA